MARAQFTFDEMVYNSICQGKQIYHDEDDTLYTISYVKLLKDIRAVQIHTVEGEVFLANQDDEFEFEVNDPKLRKKPTKRKVKGKNRD